MVRRAPLYCLLCWLRAGISHIVARVGLVAFRPSLSSSDRVALPSDVCASTPVPRHLPHRKNSPRLFYETVPRNCQKTCRLAFSRRRPRRRHEGHGDHPSRRGLDLALRGCGIRSFQPQAAVVENRTAQVELPVTIYPDAARRMQGRRSLSKKALPSSQLVHSSDALHKANDSATGASLPCLRKTNEPS